MAIKANKFKTIDLLSPPQAEKNKEQKAHWKADLIRVQEINHHLAEERCSPEPIVGVCGTKCHYQESFRF